MPPPRGRRVVVLARALDEVRIRPVLRWARALLPAAALAVVPVDGARAESCDDGAIVVDLDEVASSPLSLAAAIARAREPGGGRAGPTADD